MPKLEAKAFKSPIAFSLARQFEEMWEMTRQAIDLLPDDEWTVGVKGDEEWFYSLRVYHMLETAEFYSRDTPKGMLWGARLGKVNWWETISHKEASEKIIKGDMRIYLDEIARYIRSNLQRVSDVELLQKDGFHQFASVLEKFQYLLRHNTYHLGELTMQLRCLGHNRIKWE